MSRAKKEGQVAYNVDNRPLWSWNDEVDWTLDDIADGDMKPGEERVFSNGYIAVYTIDADGDGFLFVSSRHTDADGSAVDTIQFVKPLGRVVEVSNGEVAA